MGYQTLLSLYVVAECWLARQRCYSQYFLCRDGVVKIWLYPAVAESTAGSVPHCGLTLKVRTFEAPRTSLCVTYFIILIQQLWQLVLISLIIINLGCMSSRYFSIFSFCKWFTSLFFFISKPLQFSDKVPYGFWARQTVVSMNDIRRCWNVLVGSKGFCFWRKTDEMTKNTIVAKILTFFY